MLKRIIEEGRLKRPGMVNSVNEEGTKCETLFPLIAGTDWNVIGLTCDKQGIPMQPDKKLEIAKSIIDKADHFGVKLSNLHIDPCVMALRPHRLPWMILHFVLKRSMRSHRK